VIIAPELLMPGRFPPDTNSLFDPGNTKPLFPTFGLSLNPSCWVVVNFGFEPVFCLPLKIQTGPLTSCSNFAGTAWLSAPEPLTVCSRLLPANFTYLKPYHLVLPAFLVKPVNVVSGRHQQAHGVLLTQHARVVR
jgi:hypothetical protein